MSKKIAIVHDQLQEFGGAERVLLAIKKIFPQADVFTSFYNPEALGMHASHFAGWNIRTSWAQRVPFFNKLYSPLRFLTPYIWEAFQLQGYDLVISSTGSYMCKGIITRPETKHISYIHHPPRYLYYYETAREWQKYLPIRIYGHLINHGLRIWDFLSSQRPDCFVANSQETKARVKKYYRRDAQVLYPPVEIPETLPKNPPQKNKATRPYYITTSRLARAKHIDILIHAANTAGFDLKIIGTGRDKEFLEEIAGNSVEFLSHISDAEFRDLYLNAHAYLFASVDEEFGIAPIEAMGHGVPVIAFASGGLKETVKHGENGFLYEELSKESLLQAIRTFEKLPMEKKRAMRSAARATAEGYSFETFRTGLLQIVESL